MEDIIDRASGAFSGNKYNITTYLLDMSGGRLVVVGQPLYKRTRYSLAQYQAPISRHDAEAAGYPLDAGRNFSTNVRYWGVRHALEELDVRNNFDFTPFDRWTLNGPYNYRDGADGVIDMIFVCWRNDGSDASGKRDPSFLIGRQRSDGVAELGQDRDLFDTLDGTPLPVGNGLRRRTVKFTYPGSGVTVFNMREYPRMASMLHEFGHYLGLPHQYGGGMWSIMGQHSPSAGYAMNSWERARLGWGTLIDITSERERGVIGDLSTTYRAYRLTIDSARRGHFLIEHHARLPSPFIRRLPSMSLRPWGRADVDPYWDLMSYDVVDGSNGGAPGLYVVEQRGDHGSLRVVCADGGWSWRQALCPQGTIAAPWDPAERQHLAVWERGTIDRVHGECDRAIHAGWRTCDPAPIDMPADYIWAWRDPETEEIILNRPKHRGDGRDRWYIEEENVAGGITIAGGCTVFTPWSNPSTRSLGDTSMAGMELLAKNGTDYIVQFYRSGAIDASPSAPQDLRINAEYTWCGAVLCPRPPWISKLTWIANEEPDVNPGGHYQIWRRLEPAGEPPDEWERVADLAGEQSAWRDEDIWANDPAAPRSGNQVRYRIRAVDAQGKPSVFSEERSIEYHVDHDKRRRPIEEPATEIAAWIAPNPIAGRGKLHVDVPVAGELAIDLHDLFGRRVAVLDGNNADAGENIFDLDISSLPTGVYTCFIRQEDTSTTLKVIVNR